MSDDPSDQLYGPELARLHEAGFGAPGREAADLLLRLLGPRTGVRVVDLGCGAGAAAGPLVEAGLHVVGIDPSPAMLDLAREQVPGGRFVLGAIQDPDPLPACEAVLVVGEVVNYAGPAGLPSAAALATLLTRIADALAPDGILLLDAAGPGRSGSRSPGAAPPRRATRVGAQRVEVEVVESAGWLERSITVREPDGRVADREIHRLRLLGPDEVDAALAAAGFAARRLGPGLAWTQGAPGWHAWAAAQDPAALAHLRGGSGTRL